MLACVVLMGLITPEKSVERVGDGGSETVLASSPISSSDQSVLCGTFKAGLLEA